MTSKELTAIALKLFAMYIAVHMVSGIPQIILAFTFLRDSADPMISEYGYVGVEIVALVIIAILAVMIWRLSNRVIDVADARKGIIPTENFEEFTLAVLGLFFVVTALSKIVYLTASAYVQATDPNNINGFAVQSVSMFVSYGLQLVIGMTLVLRTKGWLRIYNSMREAGLDD